MQPQLAGLLLREGKKGMQDGKGGEGWRSEGKGAEHGGEEEKPTYT